MDIINRVKNILVSPKTEWTTIEAENEPHVKLFTTYVVPLSLISAIAAFIGYGVIGMSIFGVRVAMIGLGIRMAAVQLISMLVGVYLTAFIINILADNFGAKKDLNRAFSLVAYSYTAMFVAGVFLLLPSLSWITTITGIYSLYLLYIGLQPMMKAPADKQTVYFVVTLLVMLVISFGLMYAMRSILFPGFGLYM